MGNEKETKERLLASAKQEFMEKGYQKASLRSICKNAGVTTGALYFFFRDKEDLFASLVKPVFSMVGNLLREHMRQEMLELAGGHEEELSEMSDDAYASMRAVHLLYENYDEVQLLLTKSQGSRQEGYVDALVSQVEQGYRRLADAQAAQLGISAPDDYTIHWVAHMQIDAFVHLLTHEPDEKKAYEHLEDILKYLVSGWYGLFAVAQEPNSKKQESKMPK